MTTLDGIPSLPGLGVVDGLDAAWGHRCQTVAGLRFVATSPARAAEDIVRAAASPEPRGEHVHLANAYSVALASTSPALALAAFDSEGWNLPDGRPLQWVSALRRHRPRLRQVPGPALFEDVCAEGIRPGLRHYLLGGSPEVVARLQEELERRHPGIRIVGADSPPFRAPSPAELAARDRRIRDSGAQIVWVGLGTPKQDVEVARLAAGLPVVAVAIGAGFDFVAGSLRRAPHWISVIGMEWLFRLVMEPRRLWRRYLFGNVRFLIEVLRDAGRPARG